MPSKADIQRLAWNWVNSISDAAQINTSHLQSSYCLQQSFCKGECRRNCQGNPRCLSGLGERVWLQDNPDEYWHGIDDPTTEIRQGGSYIGLKNLGATCYLNSLLQVWFHNASLRKAIYMWNPAEDPDERESFLSDNYTPHSALGHLQLLFALLQFSERRYIDPSALVESLGLNVTQQQDAQEFCKLFISLVEERMSFQSESRVRNVVQEQYSGDYVYVTRCEACKTESSRHSVFYELDLSIVGHKNLAASIDEFLQEEKLEGNNQYSCDVCKGPRNAVRFIRLKHLPPVLNMQLLRFVFDRATGRKKKLNSFIRFPEVLDLSPHMGVPDNTFVYELTSVLIHRGASAHSGHYIAHIKDRHTANWYKFNDESVEKVGAKRLQLESDDGLDVAPPRGGGSKRVHSSNNAYMLVYTSREVAAKAEPSDRDPIWKSSLPAHLTKAVADDNGKLREWIRELEEVRGQSVQSGRSRELEVRSIYKLMDVPDDVPREWISTKWLSKWLNEPDVESVPPIDNNGLLCPHDRISLDQVVAAKYISCAAVDELVKKYGGGPRIPATLCEVCVRQRWQVLTVKGRIAEDQKLISKLLKVKPDTGERAHWVGKEAMRTWRRKAALINHIKLDETEQENSSNAPTENEAVDEEFNAEIRCSHGGLSLEEGSRRLIQGEIWDVLKSYFPRVAEFQSTTMPCETCTFERDSKQEQLVALSVQAIEERQALAELGGDRNRPDPKKLASGTTLYAVNTQFLLKLRAFWRCPKSRMRPNGVDNAALLCSHNRLDCLVVIPENEIHTRMHLVWPHEWEMVRSRFEVDREISLVVNDRVSVTPVSKSGSPIHFSRSVCRSDPDLCDECISAHIAEENQRRADFERGRITILRIATTATVNSKDTPDNGTENNNNGMSNGGGNTSSANGSDDSASDSSGVPSSKKRKLTTDEVTVTSDVATPVAPSISSGSGDCPESLSIRRSNRTRAIKGTRRNLLVNGAEKFIDLKLKIMRLFDVAPFDQHLSLNGKPIEGEKDDTLAALNIFPGVTLTLTVDEELSQEDITRFLDEGKGPSPEVGFKGTKLQS